MLSHESNYGFWVGSYGVNLDVGSFEDSSSVSPSSGFSSDVLDGGNDRGGRLEDAVCVSAGYFSVVGEHVRWDAGDGSPEFEVDGSRYLIVEVAWVVGVERDRCACLWVVPGSVRVGGDELSSE